MWLRKAILGCFKICDMARSRFLRSTAIVCAEAYRFSTLKAAGNYLETSAHDSIRSFGDELVIAESLFALYSTRIDDRIIPPELRNFRSLCKGSRRNRMMQNKTGNEAVHVFNHHFTIAVLHQTQAQD